MAWQGLKLNLKVSQKQILTPGLVQMVSVLALNRLELREIDQPEMIAKPGPGRTERRADAIRQLQRRNLPEGRNRKSPGEAGSKSL